MCLRGAASWCLVEALPSGASLRCRLSGYFLSHKWFSPVCITHFHTIVIYILIQRPLSFGIIILTCLNVPVHTMNIILLGVTTESLVDVSNSTDNTVTNGKQCRTLFSLASVLCSSLVTYVFLVLIRILYLLPLVQQLDSNALLMFISLTGPQKLV